MVTWSFLGLNTCFWAVSLGGVAALSKVYSGPSSSNQVPLSSYAASWAYAGRLFELPETIAGSISIKLLSVYQTGPAQAAA